MRFAFFILWQLLATALWAQMPQFHSLTTTEGLNDGVIRSFGQDKYGYTWIGTQSGLNRYDGYTVKRFLHVAGDTNSICPGEVLSIFCSENGNLYIGFFNGLVQYNYATDKFTRIKTERQFAVSKMINGEKNNILLATSKGLAQLDTKTNAISFFADKQQDTVNKNFATRGLNDICKTPGGLVIATSRAGLLTFDLARGSLRRKLVPRLDSVTYTSIEISKKGNIWCSLYNEAKLIRTDTTFSSFTIYDSLPLDYGFMVHPIGDLLIDNKDQLWVTTVRDGLCLYNDKTDKFANFVNDPFLSTSPHVDHMSKIFQNNQGVIWIGSEGHGVSYFRPEKTFFQTILPKGNAVKVGGWLWSRAASEDGKGNLWLATGFGAYRYNLATGDLKTFRNDDNQPQQIHYNSVRSVLCDDDVVWIITGKGINKYHPATDKMDFLDAKDSLPPGFYFTSYKDSRGTIWIGGRDWDGLFYKERNKPFIGISHHPVLKALHKIWGYGVRCIFEDSKKRMWFGLNSGGLILFDVVQQKLTHWQWKESDSTSLVGNLVTGIAEDHDGDMWVSTTSGIACYHSKRNCFTQYTQQDGLPSIRTSSIQVDAHNRVWAGSTRGLLMLNQKRQIWKIFDEHDGLLYAEFADMPSYVMKDGRFVFPSLQGFVVFNPNDYTEQKQALTTYISAIKVFNKPATLAANYEELKNIYFKHDQNFFTIELAALNYDNPSQTWYAYKLEGFDKDWVYTKDRSVNYTNVPGGSYRFFYKASTNPNDWAVPEKELLVVVDTVYYKTVAFWCAIALAVGAGLYFIYRFRTNKQQQIVKLETKARELGKEKAVVQYESLKQHLNPHFLFNSLTSLRSLIKTDSKTATVFLDGLSKVYRYVLKSGEIELITLKEELEFAQTFISLQKIRFKEGLQISIDVDDSWHKRYIVPVTLQNLVENAIKHNTTSSESPLHISITTEDDYVIVSNNLQRYNIVETSNKKGINSLKHLYHFYTQQPIIIEDDTKTFTVKIPLL